jgi:hypothetical protein
MGKNACRSDAVIGGHVPADRLIDTDHHRFGV